MRRSNCSAPIPPGHPRVHHFFGDCPGLFITLFLPCPALINHFNPFIFHCSFPFSPRFPVPRPFLSHTFFLWPRGCPGGDGGKTIWEEITWFSSSWKPSATLFLERNVKWIEPRSFPTRPLLSCLRLTCYIYANVFSYCLQIGSRFSMISQLLFF